MPVCKRVHYSGRVQGVGFRYTAARIAQSFSVAGYVKNLANGQVELLVEGEPVEIDRFLAEVARQMPGYIQGQSVKEETLQGFDKFEIRS